MEVTIDMAEVLAGIALLVGLVAGSITISAHLLKKDRLRHDENMKMIDHRHEEISALIDSLARSQPSYDTSVGGRVFFVDKERD